MDEFEKIWEFREESLYPEMFGGEGRGIFNLDAELFTHLYGQATYDPRWLLHGVFEYPPHGERKSWLYVSSGMSNPWDDDPETYATLAVSGLGVEFVMETPAQAAWAIHMLRGMIAYNLLLLACGRYGDRPTLAYGHQIPFKEPGAFGGESQLRNLVIVKPDHYPDSFRLASGEVRILHFIGITDEELAYAKSTRSAALAALLKDKGVYPLTDRDRSSVV